MHPKWMNYRDTTANHAKMAGVTVLRRKCSVCGKHKQLDKGHKNKPAFICADCVKEQFNEHT